MLYTQRSKLYFQIVIADSNDGILVFIQKPELLPVLSKDMVKKAKLIITIFHVENGYITTDECANTELDIEVMSFIFY